MNPLLVFLPIAFLLLAVLLVWALRTESVAGSKAFSGAQEALDSFELELPPRVLVERIFAWQDWEFVSRQTPPRIQRMFLRERRAIALAWLCQTRRQAARLVDFHVRVVRRNVNLRPTAEIGLAFRYVLFLLESGVLGLLIRLGGPFHSRRMVGYAVGLAQQLGYMSGQVLDCMSAARIDAGKANWTNGAAAS